MKVLIITFTFLLFTFFSHSQIEMNSSGDVGIGTSLSSSRALFVKGGTISFQPGSSSFSRLDMKVDGSYFKFEPILNSIGSLG